MVLTTPYHLNPARSAGKQGIYIEGGRGSGPPPPKHRGRGVVRATPYHLHMFDRPVTKAWCPGTHPAPKAPEIKNYIECTNAKALKMFGRTNFVPDKFW